ncbi:MAG: peptidoglycan-binding domain-containing protein [Gammaproteobacteria bacterium]|nr:peptidoglycan-binding domain-containing protein [Gammaproteobacteria bacterium]
MKKSVNTILAGAVAVIIGAAAAPSAFAAMPANPCSAHHGSKMTMKTHMRAAASAKVKAVQEALNKAGAKLKADGFMGARTRAAIKEFQSKHGLKATGYAGPATLKALDVK